MFLAIDLHELLILIVSASSRVGKEVSSSVKMVCKASGVACYEASDDGEYLLTLAWLDTIQYIYDVDGCIDDLGCVEALLKLFGDVLGIAVREDYVFEIDLEKLQSLHLIDCV